jgi:hypothetical protein
MEMEEDDFYLMLQSSALGLRLTAADIEGIKDELPPEESGIVDYGEVCHDLDDHLETIYKEHPRAKSAEWCRLYTELDGIFYHNKSTQEHKTKRPHLFKPAHSENDIDNFLFDLFGRSDEGNSGLINDEIFWALLEAPAPAGVGIAGDDSVSMMTTFDMSEDGMVPYRRFAPLFRPLVMHVSAENGGHDIGEDWVKLDGFWFDKVTGGSTRYNPALGPDGQIRRAFAFEPVVNVGPVVLLPEEETGPVYSQLTNYYPSTINLFASYLPPEKSSGGPIVAGLVPGGGSDAASFPSALGLLSAVPNLHDPNYHGDDEDNNHTNEEGNELEEVGEEILKFNLAPPFGISINGDVELGIFITGINKEEGSARNARSWEGRAIECGMRIVQIGNETVHGYDDKATVVQHMRRAKGVIEMGFVEDFEAYARFLMEKVGYLEQSVLEPFELSLTAPFGMNIAGGSSLGIFVTGTNATGSLHAAGIENNTLVEVGTRVLAVDGQPVAGMTKGDVVAMLQAGAGQRREVVVQFVFDPIGYVEFATARKQESQIESGKQSLVPTEFDLTSPLGVSMSGSAETGIFLVAIKPTGSASKAVHASGKTIVPNLRVMTVNGESCEGKGVGEVSQLIAASGKNVTLGLVDDVDALNEFLGVRKEVAQAVEAATKIQAVRCFFCVRFVMLDPTPAGLKPAYVAIRPHLFDCPPSYKCHLFHGAPTPKGFRGYKARQEMKQQTNAATTIQAQFRGYQARKSLTAEELTTIKNVPKSNAINVDTLEEEVALEGTDEEIEAATKIQAGFRGYQARQQVKQRKASLVDLDTMTNTQVDVTVLEAETKAATTIQAGWRGHQARKEFKGRQDSVIDVDTGIETSVELVGLEDKAATTIQAGWRDHKSRQEADLALEKRMVAQEKEEKGDAIDYTDPMVIDATVTIQSGFRGMKARQNVHQVRRESYSTALPLEALEDDVDAFVGSPEEHAAAHKDHRMRNIKSGSKLRDHSSLPPPTAEEIETYIEKEPAAAAVDEALMFEGTDEENAAAAKIQAGFRGSQVRKEADLALEKRMVAQEKEEQGDAIDYTDPMVIDATVTIQSGFRGMKARQSVHQVRRESYSTALPLEAEAPASEATLDVAAEEEGAGAAAVEGVPMFEGTDEENAAAAKIQAGFRGSQVRKEMKAGKNDDVAAMPEEAAPAVEVAAWAAEAEPEPAAPSTDETPAEAPASATSPTEAPTEPTAEAPAPAADPEVAAVPAPAAEPEPEVGASTKGTTEAPAEAVAAPADGDAAPAEVEAVVALAEGEDAPAVASGYAAEITTEAPTEVAAAPAEMEVVIASAEGEDALAAEPGDAAANPPAGAGDADTAPSTAVGDDDAASPSAEGAVDVALAAESVSTAAAVEGDTASTAKRDAATEGDAALSSDEAATPAQAETNPTSAVEEPVARTAMDDGAPATIESASPTTADETSKTEDSPASTSEEATGEPEVIPEDTPATVEAIPHIEAEVPTEEAAAEASAVEADTAPTTDADVSVEEVASARSVIADALASLEGAGSDVPNAPAAVVETPEASPSEATGPAAEAAPEEATPTHAAEQ